MLHPLRRAFSAGTLLSTVALAVATALGMSSCTSSPTDASPPIELKFWSGIASSLTSDLAALYSANIPGLHVSVQSVPGSLVVVSRVNDVGALGFAQSDLVYMAYRQGVEHSEYAHTNLRGIAVLWVNNMYVLVPARTSARSIADFRGKRVAALVPGTSGEFMTRIVLGAYGLSYKDVDMRFLPGDEMMRQLVAGEVDAAITSYPLLTTSMQRAAHEVGLRLLPITAEEVTGHRADLPFVRSVTIPAGQIEGQQEDVPSIGVEALLICRSDLSEQLVYNLTREFFQVRPQFEARHPELRLIDREQASSTPIPLHPGAARYYREREVLDQ